MKKKVLLTFLIILLGIGFIYSQTIIVTSPHSGDTWVKGQRYTIRWTKSGNMNDFVKIRLYKGSTKILGITDRTENDGRFNWTVSNTISPGTYKIRVKTVDNQVYDDSENFTIKNPYIRIESPSSNDVWYKGKTYRIKWKAGGILSGTLIKISIYKDLIVPSNSKQQLTCTSNVSKSLSQTESWTIPTDFESGKYYIRIKTGDGSVYGDSAAFIISNPLVKNGNLITKKSTTRPVSKLKFSDLAVLREDISKKVEGFYEKIKIHVVVKNIGLADAGSVPYLFKIIRTSKGINSTVLAERGNLPPIQRGEEATFDESYSISLSKLMGSEKYTFIFKVNPLDNGKRVIIETSYNNNKISKAISFYPKIK